MLEKIILYDTSLRDGTQSKYVNLSISNKINLLIILDSVGIDYIELGWPGSNEEDLKVFNYASKIPLRHAKIVAFGSTRKINIGVEDDHNLSAILKSKAKIATLFGKADMDLIKYQLKTTPKKNINAIEDSIKYLKSRGLEKVFYDSEHYFDGYKKSKDIALETLIAAHNAGADCLILCDTNGGSMPWEIEQIILGTLDSLSSKNIYPQWGIHAHNDADVGVANALTAVRCGFTHVQGTINGYGERVGNSNMVPIIANLMQKMGKTTNFDLKRLTELSRHFDYLAQIEPNPRAPYVGESAFTHVAGIHVDAIRKFEEKGIKPVAYEHIDPGSVGNKRKIVVSELSGRSNIILDGMQFEFEIKENDPRIKEMLKEVENLKQKGYITSGLEAETFLLLDKYFGLNKKYFELKGWDVQTKKLTDVLQENNATLLGIVNGVEKNGTYSETLFSETEKKEDKLGNGPVKAIYNAFLDLLKEDYPHIFKKGGGVELIDFDVKLIGKNTFRAKEKFIYRTILGKKHGRTQYKEEEWETIGVSDNTINASVEAAYKAFNYILKITTKSLSEVIKENSSEEEVYALVGEKFDLNKEDIDLLYRLGQHYRRREGKKRKNIELEVAFSYLENTFKRKISAEVRNSIMKCLKLYSHDPAFLNPEANPSEELHNTFENNLNTVYDKTKIGKYNRQFDYVAKNIGKLHRKLNDYISQTGLNDKEIQKMKESIIKPLELIGLMFKRYWKSHGEDFYSRINYWQKN